MNAWLSSGLLIDIAVAAIVIELVVLIAWRARSGDDSYRPLDVAGHLAAGVFLMLACRNEVVGGERVVTLLLLSASFPAHVFDLARRLRRSRGASMDGA